MSLFYKCDCCGQTMHKLGDNNQKRLHMNIGEQTDYDFNEEDKPCWSIDEYPLIQLDLCRSCYCELIAKVRVMRKAGDLSDDLKEVSFGGKSV